MNTITSASAKVHRTVFDVDCSDLEAGNAIVARAQWMQELGMDDREISRLCDLMQYPADLDEELRSSNAMHRLKERWARRS